MSKSSSKKHAVTVISRSVFRSLARAPAMNRQALCMELCAYVALYKTMPISFVLRRKSHRRSPVSVASLRGYMLTLALHRSRSASSFLRAQSSASETTPPGTGPNAHWQKHVKQQVFRTSTHREKERSMGQSWSLHL